MSEAATKGRIVRQRWAVPGSAHDKLVRWSKVVLPMAVGVLVAVLAVAPLGKNGDVSFILDKKKVENAPERMRVEAARYVGADNKGQQFQISANSAIQRSGDRRLGRDGGFVLGALACVPSSMDFARSTFCS